MAKKRTKSKSYTTTKCLNVGRNYKRRTLLITAKNCHYKL